jgi:hypothetical protein
VIGTKGAFGHRYGSILAGKTDSAILSPSHSIEFDSYDLLEDEMLRGFAFKQQ